MSIKKRLLALVLVLIMVLNWIPVSAVAENFGTVNNSQSFGGPLGLTASSGIDPDSGFASNLEGLTKFENSGLLPFSENEKLTVYAPEDMVTFVVVLDSEPLLVRFSVDEVGQQTDAVAAYQQELDRKVAAV